MKIVSRLVVICSLSVASFSSFAFPGIGGGAPEIQSSATVVISNNKAKNIKAGGANGTIGAKLGKTPVGVDVQGAGETNVNSLVVHGGGKIGGTVVIDNNEADGVENMGGGTVNVNSVVLK